MILKRDLSGLRWGEKTFKFHIGIAHSWGALETEQVTAGLYEQRKHKEIHLCSGLKV